MGITAAASLITFPTCFFGGQAIAGALMTMSIKVSENVAKAVATTVGGLVGSGVHSGAYVLQCEVDGRPIEPLGVVLSGFGGFFEGSSASYLGAKLVAAKFNPYKRVKTMKFSQDNHDVEVYKIPDGTAEAAALKELDAGPQLFPGRTPFAERSREWLTSFFGQRRNSVATGESVSVGRNSVWSFDDDLERGVDELARALAKEEKALSPLKTNWVRIMSTSNRAQKVLYRNGGKELLFLEHAEPSGFGAFDVNQYEAFARMITKLRLPPGVKPETITLLGCDVPQEFALNLQTTLSRQLQQKVTVKTLPFAEEGSRLAHRWATDNMWEHWQRIDDIQAFRKKHGSFYDYRLRTTPIDPTKPYLKSVISSSDESGVDVLVDSLRGAEMKENTDFWYTLFKTHTEDLPNHAIPVRAKNN